VEFVAHRAGNLAASLPAALAVTDIVELDVHLFRGRLEVRHSKVLWPFARRWDRWYFEPRSSTRPKLDEVLSLVPPGSHLWIDLKGADRRLTRRVVGLVGDDFKLTVSARAWWILAPADDRPNTRVMRSVGTRWQRWLLRWLGTGDRGLVLHERLLTPAAIGWLRPRTPYLFAWAADTLARIRELAAQGIDGVIVDDLGLLSRARDDAQGGHHDV